MKLRSDSSATFFRLNLDLLHYKETGPGTINSQPVRNGIHTYVFMYVHMYIYMYIYRSISPCMKIVIDDVMPREREGGELFYTT
jgi:hypothetical protein